MKKLLEGKITKLSESKRLKGVVRFYSLAREFGYINIPGKSDGILFYDSDVQKNGYLKKGDMVSFETGEQNRAVNITRLKINK